MLINYGTNLTSLLYTDNNIFEFLLKSNILLPGLTTVSYIARRSSPVGRIYINPVTNPKLTTIEIGFYSEEDILSEIRFATHPSIKLIRLTFIGKHKWTPSQIFKQQVTDAFHSKSNYGPEITFVKEIQHKFKLPN